MAERETSMTSAREQRRVGLSQPWGGGPFRMLQRMADEMDRMFDDFGLGRRWASSRDMGTEMWAPRSTYFRRTTS